MFFLKGFEDPVNLTISSCEVFVVDTLQLYSHLLNPRFGDLPQGLHKVWYALDHSSPRVSLITQGQSLFTKSQPPSSNKA